MTPVLAPPPKQPRRTLAAAIAFVAGVAAGGTMPPVITHGDAPADAPGWVCEAVGPKFDAQLVCRFEEEGWGQPMDAFASPDDCGWSERRLPNGGVLHAPIPCPPGMRKPRTPDTMPVTESSTDGGAP